MITLSENKYDKLFITFSISTLTVGIFVLVKYILLEGTVTLRDVMLLYTNIHIPYYALYLIVSLLGLYFIKIQSRFLYLYFLFSFTILLFLGSKMGILNLVFISSLYIILEQRKIVKYVIPLLIILLPLSFFYTPFGKRFNQEVIKQTDKSRVRNWASGKKTISNSLWLGYGVGNTQEALQKYRPKNSYEYKERYNSHNQFIAIAVAFGIIGLILYFFMMFYYLYIGYIKNNYFLILFILLFNISSFTENLFDRQKGIVLFSVMVPLLISKMKK
ncbi:O-antigen ligase family protein [Flammeovirga kamogawensis]|uniref:O-antigen ligase family protein n=1 Tax=Flammeovirga kamogawensis TaxID=373891 RepID=A0ABX8GT15_9BACT|nr:O-antigen ligase family protein [Flammeovirga kamogawensis]MBB6461532.1 O-antigen ligase [Flammeovirga kamogawensis]QWG06422.1 O-antigen ligase family protein [Flammeovirga kamogawensis]TRX68251.1 O-antigen ligase family protein [Flammeovirga kamogawensis]